MEIVRLVANGLTNVEIAARLGWGKGTIRNRMSYLLDAFGASTRTGLVFAAIKAGTLDLDDVQVGK